MKLFIQKFGEKVIAILNGFDRPVLKGMMSFLYEPNGPLKDFGLQVEKSNHEAKRSLL